MSILCYCLFEVLLLIIINVFDECNLLLYQIFFIFYYFLFFLTITSCANGNLPSFSAIDVCVSLILSFLNFILNRFILYNIYMYI